MFLILKGKRIRKLDNERYTRKGNAVEKDVRHGRMALGPRARPEGLGLGRVGEAGQADSRQLRQEDARPVSLSLPTGLRGSLSLPTGLHDSSPCRPLGDEREFRWVGGVFEAATQSGTEMMKKPRSPWRSTVVEVVPSPSEVTVATSVSYGPSGIGE